MQGYENKKYKEEKEWDEFIKKWLPYVKWIAGRLSIYAPESMDSEDIISEGLIGLLRAAENYDPNRGVDFKTYAFYKIKGAIMDKFRKMSYKSKAARIKEKMILEAYNKLEEKFGRMPTEDEVAKELNISVDKFHKMLEEIRGPELLSLDANISEEIIETDDKILSDIEKKKEIKKVLMEEIDKLPEREKTIIALYYYEDLTMKEIGKIIGVNESRVCQLHSQILLHLKNVLKKYI